MSNLKWILLGGLAVALLTPKSGKELREDTKNLLDKVIEDIKNLSPEDLAKVFGEKVDLVKSYVANIDFSKMKDNLTEAILNKKDEVAALVRKRETEKNIEM